MGVSNTLRPSAHKKNHNPTLYKWTVVSYEHSLIYLLCYNSYATSYVSFFSLLLEETSSQVLSLQQQT